MAKRKSTRKTSGTGTTVFFSVPCENTGVFMDGYHMTEEIVDGKLTSIAAVAARISMGMTV